MEHLQHFGLSQDPFNNEPDLRFYFESVRHREALLRVDRGLRQNKGFTLLTGEPGTGKTLLARRLFESLEEEIFEVALMVILPGAADAQSVLTRFARQFGVEEPTADRSALLGQIYEQLAIVREDGRHAVLIIDDAHALEASALAEIAGLLSLEYEDKRLLSLLMVGQPTLDQCLARDASLLQRVDVRVRLEPLDLADTTAYVAHRLATVGGKLEIAPSPTIEVLFKYARGRTRLINTLADNALFEAYLGARPQIEPADVERAASDLGIGADPGMTYGPHALGSMGGTRGGASGSASVAQPLEADPVMGDMVIPEASFEMAEDPAVASATELLEMADEAETEFGGLFDTQGGAMNEPTCVIDAAIEPPQAPVDLDAEMDAILAEPEPANVVEALPVFSAENDGTPDVEATRIAFDVVDGPGAPTEIEELDDLFVELIEE